MFWTSNNVTCNHLDLETQIVSCSIEDLGISAAFGVFPPKWAFRSNWMRASWMRLSNIVPTRVQHSSSDVGWSTTQNIASKVSTMTRMWRQEQATTTGCMVWIDEALRSVMELVENMTISTTHKRCFWGRQRSWHETRLRVSNATLQSFPNEWNKESRVSPPLPSTPNNSPATAVPPRNASAETATDQTQANKVCQWLAEGSVRDPCHFAHANTYESRRLWTSTKSVVNKNFRCAQVISRVTQHIGRLIVDQRADSFQTYAFQCCTRTNQNSRLNCRAGREQVLNPSSTRRVWKMTSNMSQQMKILQNDSTSITIGLPFVFCTCANSTQVMRGSANAGFENISSITSPIIVYRAVLPSPIIHKPSAHFMLQNWCPLSSHLRTTIRSPELYISLSDVVTTNTLLHSSTHSVTLHQSLHASSSPSSSPTAPSWSTHLLPSSSAISAITSNFTKSNADSISNLPKSSSCISGLRASQPAFYYPVWARRGNGGE